MSIFVDAARIIMNLGGVGSQFYGVGSAEYSGEYLASSASSMGADALTPFATVGFAKRGILLRKTLGAEQFSKVGTRTLGEAGKKAATAADIILWTITIVEILELTTGFGPPDEGDELKDGSRQFSQLSEQLKSALPDDGWNGSGSEAYAELDVALHNLAQTIAELDLQLAALVENQAEWVTHMRLGFGILKDVLLAAFLVEIVMTLLPAPAGPVPARIFGLTVSALGIAAAAGMLGNLCYWSFENAKRADALASQYTQAAAGTVQSGSLAQATAAAAGQSTVSSFATLTSTGAASGSRGEAAAPSAQVSERESPGDSTPEAPDKTTAPEPVATMPTLAQVSAMSGGAPKLTGQLSQHVNLASQAMGQIQQRQGAATPAEEAATQEASLAGDVEGAGTRAAGAQRAPIEVVINATENSPRQINWR